MPDQWERHSRSRREWDSGSASRKQQRQAAANDDPVRDHSPGKKDKNACKANHWKPHVITYKYFTNSWYLRSHVRCEWTTVWRDGQYVPVWFCGHNAECVLCGKRLGKPTVCPTRTRDDIEPPLWIVEQAKDETVKSDARRARWSPRRVVKGPSHYRKPKAQ